MTRSALLAFLVAQNNMDALGVIHWRDEVFWLLDALRIVGLYEASSAALDDPALRHTLVKEHRERLPDDLEAHAFSLDYAGGAEDLMLGLAEVVDGDA
jgi:hypothetical protein